MSFFKPSPPRFLLFFITLFLFVQIWAPQQALSNDSSYTQTLLEKESRKNLDLISQDYKELDSLIRKAQGTLPSGPFESPQNYSPIRQSIIPVDPFSLQIIYSFTITDTETGTEKEAVIEKIIRFQEFAPIGNHLVEYDEQHRRIQFIISGRAYPLTFADKRDYTRGVQAIQNIYKTCQGLLKLGEYIYSGTNREYLSQEKVSFYKKQALDWVSSHEFPNLSFIRQPKPSELARKYNYNLVVYTTNDILLTKIIKEKTLFPSTKPDKLLPQFNIGCEDAIHFSLTTLGDDWGEELLETAQNSLPLLAFSVDVLDDGPFYANSGKKRGTYISYSCPADKLIQTAESSDEPLFEKLLASPLTKQSNELIFASQVSFDHLHSIFVRTGEKRKLVREFANANLTPPAGRSWNDLIVEISPLLINSAHRSQFVSDWVKPLYAASDDKMRWIFQKEHWSIDEFIELLCMEYPDLELLFNAHPHINDPATVRSAALKLEQIWLKQKKQETLPTLSFCEQELFKRLMLIIIILHEIGAPVTAANEEPITTLAIMSAILDRLYFNQQTVKLSQAVVDSRLLDLVQGQSIDAISEKLKSYASKIEMPVSDLYAICNAFWTCKAATSSFVPKDILTTGKEGKLTLVHPQLEALTIAINQAPLYAVNTITKPKPIDLHNVYIWEKIDQKHRYGQSLQHARNRYEKALIQNPYWKWRGKFWEWLDTKDSGAKIPEVHFYTTEEQKCSQAQFVEGKLVTTQLDFLEKKNERMFVVGIDEQIYISTKTKGSATVSAHTHASFFSGEPVLSAGKMTIKQDGTILNITNHSGHYRPGAQETAYFLELLEKAGVDLKTISLDLKISDDNSIPKKFSNAKDWLSQFRAGKFDVEALQAFSKSKRKVRIAQPYTIYQN